jgi:hypothetical protein
MTDVTEPVKATPEVEPELLEKQKQTVQVDPATNEEIRSLPIGVISFIHNDLGVTNVLADVVQKALVLTNTYAEDTFDLFANNEKLDSSNITAMALAYVITLVKNDLSELGINTNEIAELPLLTTILDVVKNPVNVSSVLEDINARETEAEAFADYVDEASSGAVKAAIILDNFNDDDIDSNLIVSILAHSYTDVNKNAGEFAITINGDGVTKQKVHNEFAGTEESKVDEKVMEVKDKEEVADPKEIVAEKKIDNGVDLRSTVKELIDIYQKESKSPLIGVQLAYSPMIEMDTDPDVLLSMAKGPLFDRAMANLTNNTHHLVSVAIVAGKDDKKKVIDITFSYIDQMILSQPDIDFSHSKEEAITLLGEVYEKHL